METWRNGVLRSHKIYKYVCFYFAYKWIKIRKVREKWTRDDYRRWHWLNNLLLQHITKHPRIGLLMIFYSLYTYGIILKNSKYTFICYFVYFNGQTNLHKLLWTSGFLFLGIFQTQNSKCDTLYSVMGHSQWKVIENIT